jgi:sigma-B regulation protein RsbU (phosphoserine phosphatase)
MSSKILIVDDGFDRKIISHILHREGYEVLEAEDGAEGLKLSLETLPDLILLDINMPKLDGYGLCSLLHQDEKTANIPVIFLTSLDEAQDKIIGLEMGAVDYITKPYDIGEVTARIKNQLKIYHLTKDLLGANNELREKQNQLDEDLKAAALIQKSLLPSNFLKIDNIDLEWRFFPCDLIGGDIFNILRFDEDHVAFYVIDVSGHGVPAAMVTVSLTQTLHYHFENHNNLKCGRQYSHMLHPSDLLLTLDKEYPMERFDKYFTMVYMVLNIRNGHLVYSNAAHPPPVLLNAKGNLEVLEEGGSIIGLGGSIPFLEGVVNLKSGDKIVIYTDGLIDYQDENGNFYGEEKFYEFLKRNINLSIDKLTDKLFDELNKFGKNAKLRDDVSFLTFMYKDGS